VNSSSVQLRPAGPADADAVVALTRARRRALADWEPGYWCPSAGADETHAAFLQWCIANPGIASPFVATHEDVAVGFVMIPTRPGRLFFDDLCIADGAEWPIVGPALLSAPIQGPGLLCAPTKDAALLAWLESQPRWRPASHLFSIRVTPSEALIPSENADVTVEVPEAPPHPFGPSIHPAVPGGLRLMGQNGYVIGGVSVVPPIYDPGGPTTVIDRIVGTDRGALLREALEVAGGRGDVQVIVVADVRDTELIGLAQSNGAATPVTNWCRD
jgi:hypothetical protein